MYQHLVVGTDGSPTADEAVRQAAELAKSFGARLTIFSAYPPFDPNKTVIPEDLDSWQITSAAHAEEVVHAGASRARGLHAKVATRTDPGDPADAMIRFAEESAVDLIVVGSVGMTSARRFLLGSVPNKISHHAPCDVIIVRTAD
jgi:nucleotide-binding universal stress UspA family protein